MTGTAESRIWRTISRVVSSRPPGVLSSMRTAAACISSACLRPRTTYSSLIGWMVSFRWRTTTWPGEAAKHGMASREDRDASSMKKTRRLWLRLFTAPAVPSIVGPGASPAQRRFSDRAAAPDLLRLPPKATGWLEDRAALTPDARPRSVSVEETAAPAGAHLRDRRFARGPG